MCTQVPPILNHRPDLPSGLRDQVLEIGEALLLPWDSRIPYPPDPDPSLPLIELPPLSPGIQVRVMEEAEVLETVRRGWSGGTVRKSHQLLVEKVNPVAMMEVLRAMTGRTGPSISLPVTPPSSPFPTLVPARSASQHPGLAFLVIQSL